MNPLPSLLNEGDHSTAWVVHLLQHEQTLQPTAKCCDVFGISKKILQRSCELWWTVVTSAEPAEQPMTVHCNRQQWQRITSCNGAPIINCKCGTKTLAVFVGHWSVSEANSTTFIAGRKENGCIHSQLKTRHFRTRKRFLAARTYFQLVSRPRYVSGRSSHKMGILAG